MRKAEHRAMSPLLIAALCLTMVGTAFLSGIFGMAGGMILVGILLALLPLPEAMMLHGVTQMASNGWRALLWWRYVRWSAVTSYLLGCAAALLLWSLWRYVPSKPVAPANYRPNPDSVRQGTFYGAACMTLILLTGVSGPLIDTFFLGGKFDRREIVATKAMCQIFGHAAKLIYFGAVIEQAASVDPLVAGLAIIASMIGTSLAAKVLLAMTDRQYRSWANRIITAIAGYYVAHAAVLIVLTAR
jgi:uncharacterized membrane protein YfcA